MSPKIFRDVSFFLLLKELDRDLAERVREGGCLQCGGPLHVSRYPRKLRGLPAEAEGLFRKRQSYCCGKDECRQRATPPSVVFFGRRFYPAVMVLLASALAHGASDRRLARLSRRFAVDRKTLERWRVFWEKTFPESSFFRAEGGRFSPALSREHVLRDLLARFTVSGVDRVASALLFLSPMTTGSVPLSHARKWASETRRGGFMNAN